MEKERKVKKYSVIALIVALLGLTVVYAALSVTLNINATARANKTGINVVFEKIAGVSPSKSNGVITSLDDPELKQSGTVLNLGDITLDDPGDYYQYSINIVNKGKKTAKITGIEAPNLTELALTYFEVSYRYENGLNVGVSDTINSGQSKKVIIKVALKELTNEQYEAMSDDLVLNLNGLTITFEKADDGDTPSDVPSGGNGGDSNLSTYSFTLNNLAQLSGYNLSDGTIEVDAPAFWNLIGEDLSDDSNYYVDVGFKLFHLSIDNEDMIGASSYADTQASPGNKQYILVMNSTDNSTLEFTIFGVNDGAWDLEDSVITSSSDLDNFTQTYGNVIINIVSDSNS